MPFLGAWIEQETDGRHYLVSVDGELGYFQLHPETIEDHFGGRGAIARIRRETIASPMASMKWGGKMLALYARQLDKIGVPRGTELWHGLLKAMHWSPTARVWAEHVHNALGYWPGSYADFHQAMHDVQRFGLWKPGLQRPARFISCSPLAVLDRVSKFFTGDDQTNAHRGVAALPWPWMLPDPMLILDYLDPPPYTSKGMLHGSGGSTWWKWALGGALAVGSITGFAYLAATAVPRRG